VTQTDDITTGAIAFTVAPEHRRRGLGRAMIAALMQRPELHVVELFEAGGEPDNTPSRRCLEAAGYALRSPASHRLRQPADRGPRGGRLGDAERRKRRSELVFWHHDSG
jgi:RimJ/RimL family protein N-acetyltransferase